MDLYIHCAIRPHDAMFTEAQGQLTLLPYQTTRRCTPEHSILRPQHPRLMSRYRTGTISQLLEVALQSFLAFSTIYRVLTSRPGRYIPTERHKDGLGTDKKRKILVPAGNRTLILQTSMTDLHGSRAFLCCVVSIARPPYALIPLK